MKTIEIMRISGSPAENPIEVLEQSIKCGAAGFTNIVELDFGGDGTYEAITTREELDSEIVEEIEARFIFGPQPWGYDTEYELPDNNVKLVVI